MATTTRIKHVYGNILRVAIPLTMRTRRMNDGVVTEEEEDFYPNPAYPVNVDLYKGGGLHKSFVATMDDNVALFADEGETPIGVYQVEVTAHDMEGNPVRYMVRAIIEVVDATIDAGIEAGIEFNAETYNLEGTVFYYAKGESLYQLMVNEGRFVGTLDEFLDEYENTLKAANDAAENANATDERVQANEQVREDNEQQRIDNESLRQTEELARQEAERQRIEDTAHAIDIATHPDIVGNDNYVYHYNDTTKQYTKTDIYVRGDDGVGVASVTQVTTSHVSGGVNVWRITLTNGVTSDFEVRNGELVKPRIENHTIIF